MAGGERSADLPQPVANLVTSVDAGFVPAPLEGHRLRWHQADWRGQLEVASHLFGTFHLSSVAPAAAAAGALLAASRALLGSAASMPGCAALELRYLITPTGTGAERIDLFLTVKTYADEGGHEALTAALGAAHAALPAELVLQPIRRPEPHRWPTAGMDLVEIKRNESVLEPIYEYVPADFFYTIHHGVGDGSGWPSFWDARLRVSGPVEISFLFKQTDLALEEQAVVGAVVSDLGRFSEAHVEPDLMGNDVHYPADANARIAFESWEAMSEKVQGSVFLGRIALRGSVHDTAPLGARLAAALSASATEGRTDGFYLDGPQSPSQFQAASESFDWLEVYPWGGHDLWRSENLDVAPTSLRRLSYLYNLDDASALAVLPTPDERGAAGFAVARRHQPRRGVQQRTVDIDLELGRFLHHGEQVGRAGVTRSDLNRHLAVAGSPGSGKTTTVLSLLTRLWREHGVPFMVIEPTKREYRTLMNVGGFEDLMVIPIGREDISPFRLNPLDPPPGVRCENHISALMSMFKLALPLFPPLPQLLEEAIEHTYQAAGWHYDTLGSDGLPVPSMRDLAASFDTVFARAGYVGEAGNLGAALRVRLTSLTRGSRGRLLDTVESDDFAELMHRPVVIELEDVADVDDKAVVASLLLDRIRSAANARPERGSLKHVTVLEEAHRLLPRNVGGANDGDDARQGAVDAFCNAIAELRSTGEGFVISSQSPNRLAEAALANVGTRVVHRLESSADREVMLADLDLSEADRPLAARLGQGEAFIRTPTMDDAELVSIIAPAGVDSGALVADDTVAALMGDFAESSRRRLPFSLCDRSICRGGCSADRRRGGEATANAIADAARVTWDGSENEAMAVAGTIRLIRQSLDGDVADRFCVASHLASRREAFVSGQPDRLRTMIVEELEDGITHGS